MPRLLRCMICMSVTKLPDYDGDPTQDRQLAQVCALHQHPEAPEEARRTAGQIFRITQEQYDKMERITALNREAFEDQQWFEDTRDQLKDDAYRCWIAHRMPDKNNGCNDCESPSKEIKSDSFLPLGDEKTRSRTKQYLCWHGCPYFSGVVIPTIRKRKGMYDVK